MKGMRGGLEGPQCPVSAPGTCETARGSGRGGLARCQLADLWQWEGDSSDCKFCPTPAVNLFPRAHIPQATKARWDQEGHGASPGECSGRDGGCSEGKCRVWGLTGVQLEHELDGVVVEVAAVLDHLDEGGQAALHRRHLRERHGGVELPENWRGEHGEAPGTCLQSHQAPASSA